MSLFLVTGQAQWHQAEDGREVEEERFCQRRADGTEAAALDRAHPARGGHDRGLAQRHAADHHLAGLAIRRDPRRRGEGSEVFRALLNCGMQAGPCIQSLARCFLNSLYLRIRQDLSATHRDR